MSASHFFSYCRTPALGSQASVVASLRLSSCGVRALGHVVLAALRHVESSQTRDQTHIPCNGRWILIYCVTLEVLSYVDNIVVVRLLSRTQLFATPRTVAQQASLALTISQSSPKFMSIDRWCYPIISSSAALFSFCIQSFPASGLFQWVDSSHQVAKVLELQLQHQSFQWVFRADFS